MATNTVFIANYSSTKINFVKGQELDICQVFLYIKIAAKKIFALRLPEGFLDFACGQGGIVDCRETQHELKQAEAGKLDENRLRAALEHVRTCSLCRGSDVGPFMVVIGPSPPPSDVTEVLSVEQIDAKVTRLRMKAAICTLMAAYAGDLTSEEAEARIADSDFTDEELALVRSAAELMAKDLAEGREQRSSEDYLEYVESTKH